MLNQEQQERFAELWTEAQPAVSQYIRSVVKQPDVAGDILQSTALVLLRKFREYDQDRPFVAWALGHAKFQILGYRRDSARSLVSFDSELLDNFTETWATRAPRLSEEQYALRECLEKVSGGPREVIQLRSVDGMNSKEISKRLELSASNVRAILKRVRDSLRECITRQLGAGGGAG